MSSPACPICQDRNTELYSKSSDVEYLSSEEIYNYYMCNNCSTIFIEDFPTEKLNEIYPENYYSFQEQKKKITDQVKEFLDQLVFKKILKKFNGKSINVLDIGGGSGWLLDLIRKIYPQVNISQVVDIDENAKAIAERNGHYFFHGTIEEFQSENKFDLILMLNLIEHISQPLETLKKMESILNPGGVVLIKTPNIESLDAKIFRNSYWGGLHCPRHWILFSQKSFRLMVSQTGLKINKIKYTQGAPFWSWSFLVSWSKKGWVSITRERPIMYHPLIPLLHITFAGLDFIRLAFGSKASQMFIEMEKPGPA